MQSAILQEFLLRFNASEKEISVKFQNSRIIQFEKNELSLNETKNKELLTEMSGIESTVNELRSRYENLNKRDKNLSSKFRGEFPDMKPAMLEHLSRQFKRRPKTGQFVCSSVTYLLEMNKCIISNEKSDLLPEIYIEFLKGLNILDVMPNSLPPQIDNNRWQTLCKLRRNKIESEIKVS